LATAEIRNAALPPTKAAVKWHGFGDDQRDRRWADRGCSCVGGDGTVAPNETEAGNWITLGAKIGVEIERLVATNAEIYQ